jgi:hypothetical protein
MIHERPSAEGTWRAERVVPETGALPLPGLAATVRVSEVLPPAGPPYSVTGGGGGA